MRRIFWLIWAVAMFPLIAWALISKKTDLIPPLVLCVGLFMGLASLKRQAVNGDPTFLQPPWVWGSEFLNEVKIAVGVVFIILAIYWSTFVDWNRWTPVIAQVAVVAFAASLLTWVSFSTRVETYVHKHFVFWAAWIMVTLLLYVLINPAFKWLMLLPLAYVMYADWGKQNEEINNSPQAPSH